MTKEEAFSLTHSTENSVFSYYFGFNYFLTSTTNSVRSTANYFGVSYPLIVLIRTIVKFFSNIIIFRLYFSKFCNVLMNIIRLCTEHFIISSYRMIKIVYTLFYPLCFPRLNSQLNYFTCSSSLLIYVTKNRSNIFFRASAILRTCLGIIVDNRG